MFPVVIVIYKAPAENNNHGSELELIFYAPLPGWADDEEEIGKGKMMATITEISISEDVSRSEMPKLGERKKNKWWAN